MPNKLFKSIVAGLLIAPAGVLSSPMIAVDSADANLGTLYEGKVSAVKHVFRIKNTGDSVLVIQSVRPG